MLEVAYQMIIRAINFFKSIDLSFLGFSFTGFNFWLLLVALFFIGTIFNIIWGSDFDGDD